MAENDGGVGFASALRAPVQPGAEVWVRTASGEWVGATATSGLQGTHEGRRKVHDFPVIWVRLHGAHRDMPWPADAVRLAVGDTKASDLDSVPVEETTR